MWMMVLFDLPVLTKKERRDATKFRNFLLDQGFHMCQLSVYMRFCAGKEQTQVYTRRVERALPEAGNVQIVYFTDKQYENIVSFNGPVRRPANRNWRPGAVHSVLRRQPPFFSQATTTGANLSPSWPGDRLIISDGRSGRNRNWRT